MVLFELDHVNQFAEWKGLMSVKRSFNVGLYVSLVWIWGGSFNVGFVTAGGKLYDYLFNIVLGTELVTDNSIQELALEHYTTLKSCWRFAFHRAYRHSSWQVGLQLYKEPWTCMIRENLCSPSAFLASSVTFLA
ncbi:hypothetical protein JHK87_040289 [Glycine soja]|nr:hypothetical protein JHK87_040289 [Glycine soja]